MPLEDKLLLFFADLMFRDSPRIQHRTYIEVEDDPVRLGRGEQVTINNEEDCPPPLSSIAIPER